MKKSTLVNISFLLLSVNIASAEFSIRNIFGGKKTQPEQPAEETGPDLKFRWEITPGAGMYSGIVNEKVFTEKDELLSRLDWIDYAVPVIGCGFYGSWLNFFGKADFSLAVPYKWGKMEDRDWLDIMGNYNPLTLDATHFSTHDSYLNKNMNLSAVLGYRMSVKKVDVSPFLGYRMRNVEWTARDGVYQYDTEYYSDYHNAKEESFSGNIINFEQGYDIVFMGVDVKYNFSDWSAGVDFSFCPYLMESSRDSHYLPDLVTGLGKTFFDDLDGGFGFDINGYVNWNQWRFRIGYEFLMCNTGRTIQQSIGRYKPPHPLLGHPGVSSNRFTLSAAYSINNFNKKETASVKKKIKDALVKKLLIDKIFKK